MGRIVKIKYRVEVTTDNGIFTPVQWRGMYGTPNQANLARYVAKVEESTEPNGVNSHLGVTHILTAKIVRQKDNVIVVAYAKPLVDL